MSRLFHVIALLMMAVSLAACTLSAAPPAVQPIDTPFLTKTTTAHTLEASTPPGMPPTLTSTTIQSSATTAAGPRLCSPLKDIPLQQMSVLVSNPFHPPKPGMDDPHQGVDLAVRMPNSQVASAGHPVQAAMAGKIAMITQDRFPFGNAVIIETPLDQLPANWWLPAGLPTPAPTLSPRSALTCPAAQNSITPDASRRSLYILYAHLQEPAQLKANDEISCGQVFGTVGMTGNALNPHLHFEAKVGPSGMRIASMAHYDASATTEEMSNYCLWSVSGLFQLVDPLKVLTLAP